MSTVAGILQILSAASVGVYAGAMLTEGLVLVPYWRSASPAQFFSWYSANGARLQGFFGPVTWAAGLCSIAAALAAVWTGRPGQWTAVAAAVLMVLAVSSFFVYFARANASFSSATAVLPAELTRWASWHLARSIASIAALATAVLSLARVG